MNWLIGKLIGGAVTASTPLRMILLAKLLVYVAAALIAVATVFGGLYWIRGLRLDAAIGDAATAKAALEQCAGANASNVATITEVQGKLSECVGDAQRIDLARQEMEQVRRDFMDSQERELRKLRKTLEDRYAQDPNCVALDRMPVCRAVNDRLRTLAGPDSDG